MAMAGDIIAIAGLKDTTTGDTLCDSNKQIILEQDLDEAWRVVEETIKNWKFLKGSKK